MEREIMDALYRLGEAPVADVMGLVPNAKSYDSIRLTLGVLVDKGHVEYRREGRRYIYSPTVPASKASRSAVRRLMKTYFRGSPQKAVLAMLDESGQRMSARELKEIEQWIRKAKEAGE